MCPENKFEVCCCIALPTPPVGRHEFGSVPIRRVFNEIITRVGLPESFVLIVVPDPTPLAGKGFGLTAARSFGEIGGVEHTSAR
jgi:hypothetical protein